VHGYPRVYKALRTQLVAVLDELQRIATGTEDTINADLIEVIKLITVTMYGIKEDDLQRNKTCIGA
jgi:hypothetical protein